MIKKMFFGVTFAIILGFTPMLQAEEVNLPQTYELSQLISDFALESSQEGDSFLEVFPDSHSDLTWVNGNIQSKSDAYLWAKIPLTLLNELPKEYNSGNNYPVLRIHSPTKLGGSHAEISVHFLASYLTPKEEKTPSINLANHVFYEYLLKEGIPVVLIRNDSSTRAFSSGLFRVTIPGKKPFWMTFKTAEARRINYSTISIFYTKEEAEQNYLAPVKNI